MNKKKLITWISILILIGLCILLFIKNRNLKRIYEYANIVFTDSITVYENKISELYAMKELVITDKNTLEKRNTELYDEIKNLKDNPLVITKTIYEVRTDTIWLDTLLHHNDSVPCVYSSEFSFNDTNVSLKGRNEIDICSNTSVYTFSDIYFTGNIITSVIERDGKLYFISKSDNKYFKINNMDGAMISPENSKVLKKKMNKPWGIMVGVGPSVSIINNKVVFTGSVNITVGYKIISF